MHGKQQPIKFDTFMRNRQITIEQNKMSTVKTQPYQYSKQTRVHKPSHPRCPVLEETRNRVPKTRPGAAPVKESAHHSSNDPVKNKSKNDESFDAEDNENELASLAAKNKPKVTKYVASVSTEKRAKKAAPEHFEQEMNKHGLLDKIVHIQQLNNYFENELGGIGKKVEAPSTVAEVEGQDRSQNSPKATIMDNSKGYAFPFQKRARSNSPPKNGALLFVPKSTEKSPEQSPCDPRRKPVVARANFVIGKAVKQLNFSQKAQMVDQFLRSLESDDDFSCGLSTGPTDELKGGGVISDPAAENCDSWMYQRINASASPDGKEVKASNVKEKDDEDIVGEEEGISFLQMLNQARFDK